MRWREGNSLPSRRQQKGLPLGSEKGFGQSFDIRGRSTRKSDKKWCLEAVGTVGERSRTPACCWRGGPQPSYESRRGWIATHLMASLIRTYKLLGAIADHWNDDHGLAGCLNSCNQGDFLLDLALRRRTSNCRRSERATDASPFACSAARCSVPSNSVSRPTSCASLASPDVAAAN